MKSKKSIFVVALAALMLIAFTACEQPANIWNPNGKIPTALNITQTGDFVVGQPFDSSKFSVEVVYENGDKETASAANVTLVKANDQSTVAYVEMGDKVAASLSTVSTTGMTATVKTESAIAVSTIDSLEIDAPETWTIGETMTSEDISVVASYRTSAGVKTLTLDPSEYQVFLTSTGSDGDEATGTVKVWMSAPVEASGTGFKTGSFTTELAAKSEAEWDGTIAVRVKENATPVFFQRSEFTETGITAVYEVVANMDDGTQKTLSAAGLTGKVEYELASYYEAKNTSDTKERFPESSSVTLTVTYNHADEGGLLSPRTATINISLYQDYPTAMTATVKEGAPGKDSNNPITSGTTFANSNFTVTGTWKSAVTGADAVLADSQFTIVPGTAPEVEQAGSLTDKVKVSWAGAKYANSAADAAVTVYVAPAAN